MSRLASSIRIAVVGTRGFPRVQGGVEKHCEELYPRLVKLGCDVTVFTRTPYISKESRSTSWEGVKLVHLWCPKRKSIEAVLHTLWAIIRARLLSPDLLHIHSIGPSLLTPLAKLLGMKVVMTHHGPDYERRKWGVVARIILKWGEKLGVLYSSRIITISKGIQQHVSHLFIKNSHCIPNGVGPCLFVPAGKMLRKWQLDEGKYAFTACRYVPEKGLHDLINAYKMIQVPSFKLVIAGAADHETDYSRRICTLAAEAEGVILTGFVSGAELAELFSNAGFFVLPSYFEGLPIALLEALSFGLPVAVSDIPQHREIPLREGRYFPAGNLTMLAQVMQDVFAHGVSDLEKESYKILLKETYNWDIIAAKTFDVYKEICANRNSTSNPDLQSSCSCRG